VPRINLEGVLKSFANPDGKPVAAVDSISLTIEDRELLAVIGPSGSGKTTLLRLIAGLETPERGRISFGEQNVTEQPPQARDVAMVFQSHALFPHFTAFENLAFGLKLRGRPTAEITTRVHELAQLLGVRQCLDRPPGKLSGGERQRIALGRALIREPKVLLLDEPFAHLDEPLRAQLRAEIPALRRRFATTMIFVTHDQEEALALGDRVAIMHQGAMQQVGLPREIYNRPANRFVAAFIGSPSMNLIPGAVTKRAGRLVFLGTETEPEASGPQFLIEITGARTDWFGSNIERTVLLGFRPEAISVASDKSNANLSPAMEAKVESVQFCGAETLCQFSVGGQTLVMRTAPNSELHPGQSVRLCFDFNLAHVFDATSGAAIF
jgi:multiple sugar transport system ATP-binding protein